MNYVYASLLLHSAGKEINEDNLKKVVSAAGDQPDDAKIKALVSALEGVSIEEVISKAAMPVAITAAPAQEKKEEGPSQEEIEKKAEEAAGGLAALFG